MARFDREDTATGLPASLGTATQSLRATVEEKLREIVEAAEARAHEIEDRALASALEIEQDSERKAQDRLSSTSEGAGHLLAAIDTFEREVAQAIQSLRSRGEALASELEAAMSGEPAAPVETVQVETEAVETTEVETQPTEVETQPTGVEPPATEAPVAEDDREAIRRRILDFFLAGKPRGDAELMLAQIEDGGRYTDLLDEVYESRSETQQGSSRRRGGSRRRRPGS
jgi:hypothetical protein